ncbi:MAG: class I SAM-dependent methyltransferase [bacterium]|nr:class I SAM-dependent methyltransferase [bacterium]MBU1918845.1 class I SAM-dependent methyltransferase [bacterium]
MQIPLVSMPLLARVYDIAFGSFGKNDLSFVSEVLQRLPEGLHVDLGCANGRALEPALRQGRKVFGIDYSHDMTEMAKKRFAAAYPRQAHFETGDFRTTNLPDKVALFSCLLNTWFMIPSISDRIALLRRCKEHLVTGGIVLIINVNNPTGDPSYYGFEKFVEGIGNVKFDVDWQQGVTIESILQRRGKMTISIDGEEESHQLNNVLLTPSQFEAEVRDSGLRVFQKFGSFSKQSLDALNSEWQIYVLEN